MHTVISRARWLIFVCLTLLFVLALAVPVVGAPPEFQTVTVDDTWIDQNATDQCGFPVEFHFVGTFKISTNALKNGSVLEIDRVLNASITFTNLATGASYTSLAAGPNHITIAPDGSISSAGLGIYDVITLPGQGLLIKNVGRLVFDENGNVVFEAGTHPTVTGGDVQGLCTALS